MPVGEINVPMMQIGATAAAWAAPPLSTLVLRENQFGLETDTELQKRGDGVNVWSALPYHNKQAGGPGGGDVVGPASATDNRIVLFDSTTGKLIKESVVSIATGLIKDLTGIEFDASNYITESTGTITVAATGQINLQGGSTFSRGNLTLDTIPASGVSPVLTIEDGSETGFMSFELPATLTGNPYKIIMPDNVPSSGTKYLEFAVSTLLGVNIFTGSFVDLPAPGPHTHIASEITDFDTEVSNNTDVAANTSKLAGIEAGADVTDATNVNASGATMNTDTSLVGNGYFLDEDDMLSDDATKAASQQSIKAYVDSEVSTAITGIYTDKGNYDASTDTPSLDDGTPIAGILQGHAYTVSVAGLFFTQNVEVGDTVRALQDSPTLESHWAIAQTNLDAASVKVLYESNSDTNAFTDAEQTNLGNQSGTNTGDEVAADETTQGIIEIATQVETDADTDDTRAITPLKLANYDKWATKSDSGHSHTESDISDLGTTVAMVADKLDVFAPTTSAELASVISDETGTGVAVFSVSPALTGSPTAPTQTAADNSTKIATTAYVDTHPGIGGTAWGTALTSGAQYNINADEATATPWTITNVTDVIIDGKGHKITLPNSTHDQLLAIGTGCKRITIRNFIFVGPDTGTYNATNLHKGIEIDGATPPEHITIENCTFEKFDSHCIHGVEVGGTYDEKGIDIHACIFRDCAYDSGTTLQCAILMDDECEYSYIHDNRFEDVPKAVRGTCANWRFDNNQITGCTGGSVTAGDSPPTGEGLLYISTGTNNGKFSMSGNTFNHNEVQLIPVNITGSGATFLNQSRMINNTIIVNGIATGSKTQVRLVDCHYANLAFNNIRCHSNSGSGDDTIQIIDSEGVQIFGGVIAGGNSGSHSAIYCDATGVSDVCTVYLHGVNTANLNTGTLFTYGAGSGESGVINMTRPNVIVEAGTSLTLSYRHENAIIRFTSNSAITVTFPTNASEPLPVGFICQTIPVGNGQITGACSDTFEAPNGTKSAVKFGPMVWQKLLETTVNLGGDVTT